MEIHKILVRKLGIIRIDICLLRTESLRGGLMLFTRDLNFLWGLKNG